MKYMFQIIGILALIVGSFIYSDKVSLAAKNSDSLLNEIKSKSDNYKIEPSEPIINENTIIPGTNGQKVDINKSYNEMREIGYFDEKLLVYKKIEVEYPLNKNLDKFIINGNEDKKEIALIFKVKNNDNIDKIIDILNEKEIKGSFFITSGFMESNNELVLALLNEGHTVGNLSKNEDYTNPDFVWMKTIITNASEQNNYCYAENKNTEILDICKLQNSRTIIPTKIIKKYPLIETKSNLKSGAMIAYEINDKTEKELVNIINYIQSKGYNVSSLEKLLSE